MRIGVTGAFGFIGKSLCNQLLKKNFFVHAAVRENKKSAIDQCKNLKIIEMGDMQLKTNRSEFLLNLDCIIHCAAYVHQIKNCEKINNLNYKKKNLDFTRDLAQQAAAFGVKRFIFLSSIKVNGEQTIDSSCFKYNDISKPEDAYARSKYDAEQALLEISKKTKLEVVIIRPPLVYGEGVKANFLRLLDLVHKEVSLPFFNINNSRSFIGLDNLVDLIIHCIDHPKATGKTFLVSDGEDISTPDLIRKLSKIMGKSTRLFSFPISIIKLMSYLIGKTSEVNRLIGSLRVDSSHTRKILEWNPPFSLEEGLKKTVRWYLKNR